MNIKNNCIKHPTMLYIPTIKKTVKVPAKNKHPTHYQKRKQNQKKFQKISDKDITDSNFISGHDVIANLFKS
jgi:hypothetical protein